MAGYNVLVVDDEPGIATMCERVLQKDGFEVTALTDPVRAVDHLKLIRYDLLLVDIRMPNMGGFELIAHAKKIQPDVAVLVMTGFGTVETAIQALRQGVDGLILKPFRNHEELLRASRQALQDNQQKQDIAKMQALRPLFAVTEALLPETRVERLLDLILSAVTGHIRSAHAGFYEYHPETNQLVLTAGRGNPLPDEAINKAEGMISRSDAQVLPILENVHSPGDEKLQQQLLQHNLSGGMCAPVRRMHIRGVLFAGRSLGEDTFRDVDLEMFIILARQAAVALENARLYGELRDYIERVEESQQALVQAEKMAAAGRLSASIAHEINNPLQAVQNCLHLAGRKDLSAESREEYFRLANTEMERLMHTVHSMLDFYRPGAIYPEKTAIKDVLQHVLLLLSKPLSEKQIVIKNDIQTSLPEIMAVGGQLQQVFINLLLNAYDAMPDGGQITITTQRKGKNIEIEFEDTGTGVPEHLRLSIFEPFISTKEAGTGLGLTVSYNIISNHGGKLELVPSAGTGAKFRITLPVRKEK